MTRRREERQNKKQVEVMATADEECVGMSSAELEALAMMGFGDPNASDSEDDDSDDAFVMPPPMLVLNVLKKNHMDVAETADTLLHYKTDGAAVLHNDRDEEEDVVRRIQAIDNERSLLRQRLGLAEEEGGEGGESKGEGGGNQEDTEERNALHQEEIMELRRQLEDLDAERGAAFDEMNSQKNRLLEQLQNKDKKLAQLKDDLDESKKAPSAPGGTMALLDSLRSAPNLDAGTDALLAKLDILESQLKTLGMDTGDWDGQLASAKEGLQVWGWGCMRMAL